MVTVAVDALGGDRAPEEVVAGAAEAASDSIRPVLYGPAGLDAQGLELVETTGEIAMDEKPAEAVKAKPDSSLVAACRAVGQKQADAVVSAGNTGAMLAACFLELRRLPGVARPAIAVVIPAKHRPSGPDRRGRERGQPARAPAPVRAHGLGLRRGGAGGREAGSASALDRRGGREGQPADARGVRAAGRPPTGSTSAATPSLATCCWERPTSSSATGSPETSSSS